MSRSSRLLFETNRKCPLKGPHFYLPTEPWGISRKLGSIGVHGCELSAQHRNRFNYFDFTVNTSPFRGGEIWHSSRWESTLGFRVCSRHISRPRSVNGESILFDWLITFARWSLFKRKKAMQSWEFFNVFFPFEKWPQRANVMSESNRMFFPVDTAAVKYD